MHNTAVATPVERQSIREDDRYYDIRRSNDADYRKCTLC